MEHSMKPVLYLRIASFLTLIHAILHTIGGVFGKPPSAQAAIIAASMRYRFEVFGMMRSYADFYRGMGIGITISLTMDAAVLWVLASMARSDAARLRPIMAVFCVGYLTFALNSLAFFFSGPVIAELLIVLCLGAAIATARPRDEGDERSAESGLKTAQP
jgi:hypothetical protein